MAHLLAVNLQEVQRRIKDQPPEHCDTEKPSDVKESDRAAFLNQGTQHLLSDEEIATQVEEEVLRHGGYIECNLLYVCNPGLRKLIGERKLLQFLKAHSSLFYLSTSDSGQDIVGTLRLAATEPVSTQGQTLTSTVLGRQAARDLQDAVAKFCAAWVPKTPAHDAPFLPRVARDGGVYRKLQAFVRHCPVPTLKAEIRDSDTSGDTWVMELLHLRLFLLDRPSMFVVSDSGNPCNKGLKNCCCHLKVALSEEAKEATLAQESSSRSKKAKQNTKNGENAKSTLDSTSVTSLQSLFFDADVFVVDKPAGLSSQILQKVYQKMANEEGRGRQIR